LTVDLFSRLTTTVQLGPNDQSFVESHFDNLKEKPGYRDRGIATRLRPLGCSATPWVFRDLRARQSAEIIPLRKLSYPFQRVLLAFVSTKLSWFGALLVVSPSILP